MGPVVAVHQPQYLPWLQYFDKADRCDILVHLDNVQFQRRGYQNRNMIKTVHGPRWLTVPVSADREEKIAEVRICDEPWADTQVATITHAYGRAPAFGWFTSELQPLLVKGWTHLVDLNLATTDWAFRRFGIGCRQVRASTLGVTGTKDDLILAICQAVGARVYLSGTGAQAYQDPKKFEAAGIELQYQAYTHPTYEQCHPSLGFAANLAAIDLLLNAGDGAGAILRSGRS